MNTYTKFIPNVFVAKCTEEHEKGKIIQLETKYGKQHDCIVFNKVGQKDGFYYYSIVRADGFNYAKYKAEKYIGYAENAEKRSDAAYNASHEISKYIPFGQPILVGHHSEKRHRRDIEKINNYMGKSCEEMEKAEKYKRKSEYWKDRADTINLSMPESLEFYTFELEKAKAKHEGLKNGSIERAHGYSLTYAKKELNEIEKKLKLAVLLWGDKECV